MVSETADKDAPLEAADEVVGASQSSSQNTEASVKNSQESATTEAKQEEEDAEMPSAATEPAEDVEMAETKEEEAAPSVPMEEEDAEMSETKESSDEKKQEESESKTEEEESVAADSAEAQEKEAAETKGADGDVEMEQEQNTEEARNEDNDEAPASEKEKADANDKADGESDTVPESPKKDTADANDKADGGTPTSDAVPESPKKDTDDDDDDGEEDTPTVKVADAKVSDQGDAEMKEPDNASSPKRKEPLKPSAETSNGVATPAEPAAKKQKVDGADAKTTDESATDAAKDAASPSVMISRDDMAKMEEDSGRLKFDVITNDGTDEHMIQLTTLKNIFAKQLPKMPKEYIVRLVFDKNHKSMLILKNGTHVIGGICYRPFEKNHFAEIAFCAINASDQVKGYGTRLMNHLKEYVKTKNITHFLTYADNYAIGYFKKQGFTKSVSMARPNWYGYIKDYDGGTLMECTIHTQINYLRITSMIHMQRKAIQDKIKERSKSQTVYPGLTNFAEGRLMDIYMVPGVKEAGWSQAVIRNNRIGTRDQGSLKSQLSQLLKAVSNHRSAWPFHEPVDTSVVVDYLDHIKEPIDLQLISKRIDNGTYLSKAALKSDLEKMVDNCTTYNTPDTNYYKAAIDLREFIQSRIQIRDHQ